MCINKMIFQSIQRHNNEEDLLYKNKYINIFFAFLFTCGIILIFLIPPLAIPDENAHFINAYTISQGDFFPDYNEAEGGVGKYIPEYLAEFVKYYQNASWGGMERKISFSEMTFLSWVEVNDCDRNLIFDTNPLLSINPLAYIFSGIGLKLGIVLMHIWGNNFDTAYNLLLLSRISNFIVYCIIGMIAVKRTPCMKKIMMILLANPTAFFVCVSSSYDAIIFPFTLMFAAEILNILFREEQISVRNIVTISICSVFMMAIKMAYAPFLLILLAIPYSKYKNKNQFILCILFVLCGTFIGGLFPYILKITHERGYIASVDPNFTAQKEYLLSNLSLLPELISNSFDKYKVYYLSGFLGKLGVMDTNYPVPFLCMFFVCLIYITVVEVLKAGRISYFAKALTLFSIVISISGMFAAEYITWTPRIEPIMGDSVTGIQGRYFFPLYVFVPTLFTSTIYEKIPFLAQKAILKYQNIVFALMIIIQPISVLFLTLLRFWV